MGGDKRMIQYALETLLAPELVKAQAYGLGFDLVGITSPGPMETSPHFDAWIERGFAGEMDYLARGAEKRRDSGLAFSGVSTAIVVGLNYGGREPAGPVARYARGDDYHEVMIQRLNDLHRWLRRQSVDRFAARHTSIPAPFWSAISPGAPVSAGSARILLSSIRASDRSSSRSEEHTSELQSR